MNKSPRLKSVLDTLYRKYHHRRFVPPDPLEFVYRFQTPHDVEIAAFLASALAYGNVRQIHRSLEHLFTIIDSPAKFVNGLTLRKNPLGHFRHRFTSGRDLAEVLLLFQDIYKKFDTLEDFFLEGYDPSQNPDIIESLSSFVRNLHNQYRRRFSRPPGRGVKFLLSSPGLNSPCKRLNLFLRWMVRRDDIDPGPWSRVKPSHLIVPLDTHIFRLTRILGMHRFKSPGLKAARHITREFARLCPEDPVRYDFSLSRIGIVENCTGKFNKYCPDCELIGFCLRTNSET